jgi:hypothetical protein
MEARQAVGNGHGHGSVVHLGVTKALPMHHRGSQELWAPMPQMSEREGDLVSLARILRAGRVRFGDDTFVFACLYKMLCTDNSMHTTGGEIIKNRRSGKVWDCIPSPVGIGIVVGRRFATSRVPHDGICVTAGEVARLDRNRRHPAAPNSTRPRRIISR